MRKLYQSNRTDNPEHQYLEAGRTYKWIEVHQYVIYIKILLLMQERANQNDRNTDKNIP